MSTLKLIITTFTFLTLLTPANPAFSLEIKETVMVKTASGGNLNVRYGPKGRKIDTIKSGTSGIRILKTTGSGRNKWSRIKWSGKVGWVSSDYLKTVAYVDPDKTYQVNTKSSPLTVRRGAGRNQAALRSIPKGTSGIKILKIQKQKNDYWAYISQGGKRGWVSANFLKVARASNPDDSTTDIADPVTTTDTQNQYYTVVSGDTLYGVQRKTGENWKKIAELNNIQPPYALDLGQRLQLP